MTEKSPSVSIVCVTYNHANYIRRSIDGMLAQRTTFPVEILIHDDASTDGTADIIRQYCKEHPDTIRAVLQTENKYSKGERVSAKYLFPLCTGKYMAFCEGDDYWTDPTKLQQQVDLLEQHPEYSASFHRTTVSHEDGSASFDRPAVTGSREFSVDEFLLNKSMFYTQTMVCRTAIIREPPEWYHRSMVGDYPLFFLLAANGRLHLMDAVMSVYRRHGESLVSTMKKNDQRRDERAVRFTFNRFELLDAFDRYLNGSQRGLIGQLKRREQAKLMSLLLRDRSFIRRIAALRKVHPGMTTGFLMQGVLALLFRTLKRI